MKKQPLFIPNARYSAFLNTYNNILFAKRGTKYDRSSAAEQKTKQLWTEVTDENGDTHAIRNSGDDNVLAKKIKAMNVAGFDPSMYNMDPEQEFDRQRYRDRKAIAKSQHPEWTRRERKAWALRDDYDNPTPNIPLPELGLDPIPISGRPAAKAVITVGDVTNDPISVTTTSVPTNEYRIVKKKAKFEPVNFNQFAGTLDQLVNSSKAIKTGSNINAFQTWRGLQYEKYLEDPLNYIYEQMPENFVVNNDDLIRLRQKGYLANNTAPGYYDRDARDVTSKLLGTNTSARQFFTQKGYDDDLSKIVVYDSTGKEVADPKILASLGYGPQNNNRVTVVNNGINEIPETQYSIGIRNAVMDALFSTMNGIVNAGRGTGMVYTGAYKGAKTATDVARATTTRLPGWLQKMIGFGERYLPATIQPMTVIGEEIPRRMPSLLSWRWIPNTSPRLITAGKEILQLPAADEGLLLSTRTTPLLKP